MSLKAVALLLVIVSTLSSVEAKGWFIQQFYNASADATCSQQYVRTTAFALDVCIIRGHTSTKYSANANGDTDFYICTDNVCGECVKHVLVTSRCKTTSNNNELESMYNTKAFPDHFLPRYYVLSVTYTWGSEECLGDAEVLYITPGTECFEFCDADVQQFCSEFPKEIIEGLPFPTSSPSSITPNVSGPWFVAEYYTEPSCSQFAFAHLFELDVCMSPPNSDISSVYRLGTDGNVHEYQCHDTVCGYCKDFGVPPGYKGCAREDAHNLPVRVDLSAIPQLSTTVFRDDPSNYSYYYLNSYVSSVFPSSIEIDSTVVVYYQGYVDVGHVCGGLVDHIIVSPHFDTCVELCIYGLHFFCEVPKFLNASGVPVTTPTLSPTGAPIDHSGKKSSTGATVGIVFGVLIVVAAVGIAGFLYYKRKLAGGKSDLYSLLDTDKEPADAEELNL